MALHLVTGYAGEEHVTAQDAGALQIDMIGAGSYVFDRLNKFSCSINSNNSIRINSGEAMIQGRFVRLAKNTYEDVAIENGTTGYNRSDLIVIRYTKNSATGVENAVLAVLKGESTTGSPTTPPNTVSDISDGSGTIYEMPLYVVNISGLNISTVKSKFTTQVSLKTYIDNYQLPRASTTQYGGVAIGSGINVSNGVISVNQYSLPTASSTTLGGVKIGSGIRNSSGTISVPTATGTEAGIVKVGSGLTVSNGTLNNAYRFGVETILPTTSVTIPANSYKLVSINTIYAYNANVEGTVYGTIMKLMMNRMNASTGKYTISRAFIINPTNTPVTVEPDMVAQDGEGFFLNYIY